MKNDLLQDSKEKKVCPVLKSYVVFTFPKLIIYPLAHFPFMKSEKSTNFPRSWSGFPIWHRISSSRHHWLLCSFIDQIFFESMIGWERQSVR